MYDNKFQVLNVLFSTARIILVTSSYNTFLPLLLEQEHITSPSLSVTRKFSRAPGIFMSSRRFLWALGGFYEPSEVCSSLFSTTCNKFFDWHIHTWLFHGLQIFFLEAGKSFYSYHIQVISQNFQWELQYVDLTAKTVSVKSLPELCS